MSRDNLNTSASCPPTPTSISSRASSIPVSYKPLSPSASLSSLFRVSDEDLKRKSPEDLLHIIRRLETETKNFLSEHANIMKDVNRKVQINLLEIKGLKDINQKLQDDNQELRDLCCFLDDDRQKGRKLAKEWQRFGRYTASVMRSEVSSYQEKLKDLEVKQEDMMHDNKELKELCLYLDQERTTTNGQSSIRDRDEGDGSSNSTVNNEEQSAIERQQNMQDRQLPSSDNHRLSLNGETSNYIRQLEDKVRQLEEEKRQLGQRAERNGAEGHRAEYNYSSAPPSQSTGPQSHPVSRSSQQNEQFPRNVNPSSSRSEPYSSYNDTNSQPGARADFRQRRDYAEPPPHRRTEAPAKSPGVTPVSSSGPQAATLPPSKPEAVVHAMKVLEVHEQLERPKTDPGEENLDDNEKAIVREMCNVVWRKLGDVSDSNSQPPARSTDEEAQGLRKNNDSPPPRPQQQTSCPPDSQVVRKNNTSPPRPQVQSNYPPDSHVVRKNSPPPRNQVQNYYPPSDNSYPGRKAKSPPPRSQEQDRYPRRNVKTPPPVPSDNQPSKSYPANPRPIPHQQSVNNQQIYCHPDTYRQPLPPRDYYTNSKPTNYHQNYNHPQVPPHFHPPPPPPSTKHISNVNHAAPYPHRMHPASQGAFPTNHPHQQSNNPNAQFSHIKSPPRPPRQTYERRQTYLDGSEHAV